IRIPLKTQGKKKGRTPRGSSQPSSYNSKLPSYMSSKTVAIIAQQCSKDKDPHVEAVSCKPENYLSFWPARSSHNFPSMTSTQGGNSWYYPHHMFGRAHEDGFQFLEYYFNSPVISDE